MGSERGAPVTVKMVVTDLTRMYSGHICVAGIDLDTRNRVRPVSGLLRARLLRTNGGPFDIRAILDLGKTRDIGKAPEIEDVGFSPKKCIDLGDMPPNEFFELCVASASDSLAPIGPDLRQFKSSLATPELQGDCSLVLMKWPATPRIFVNDQGRLRYTFSDSVELSVTDVRLYQEDLETPDRQQVRILQERLKTSPDVVLAFGLGRPWKQPNDFMKRHYLQINGIHIKNEPGWQLASPLRAVAIPRAPVGPPLDSIDPNPRAGEDVSANADKKKPSFVEVAQRRYPNAFKKWSVQEQNRLREMALAGRSLRDIVSALGRGPGAIFRRLALQGLSVYGELELNEPLILRDWSEEDEASLQRMTENGESLASISKRLERPPASVGIHAELGGTERQNNSEATDAAERKDNVVHGREGASAKAGADVPDHSKKAREKYPRAYEPWSDEEDEQVLEAWRSGKTANEIAKEFGRNLGAIRSRLKRVGIDPAVGNQLEAGTTHERDQKSRNQAMSAQVRREQILRQVRARQQRSADPRESGAGPSPHAPQ